MTKNKTKKQFNSMKKLTFWTCKDPMSSGGAEPCRKKQEMHIIPRMHLG